MAASSGTSNSNANQNHHHNTSYTAQTAVENSMDTSTPGPVPSVMNGNDVQVAQQALKHDPGITVDWSIEEQSILEDGLSKFGCESTINKYIKIAALLSEKTVRDVAFRCRWMSKKENGKRRKEELNPGKKSKDKKDKPVDSIVKPAVPQVLRSTVPMYTAPMLPDSDDGIPIEAIGGTTGQLLQQNSQVIGQIKASLAACKLQETTDLLVRFRDNIFAISNSIKDMPGIISQMPPLPVMLNTELADTLLPKSIPQTLH